MAVFLIAGVSALDIENQEKLNFGHVIVVDGLSTVPATIEPGVPAVFKASLENSGSEFANNLRIELKLPAEVGFFNDVSKKKISKLNSGDSGEIEFNIIALPGISEGIYDANLTVDYVNHIGEERQDVYVISIIVKTKPYRNPAPDINNEAIANIVVA